MGVRCLEKHQKLTVLDLYQRKIMNQKDLAAKFSVSERTINRILIEAGLATPVARIKGEAYHIMKLLKKYDLELNTLRILLGTMYGPR